MMDTETTINSIQQLIVELKSLPTSDREERNHFIGQIESLDILIQEGDYRKIAGFDLYHTFDPGRIDAIFSQVSHKSSGLGFLEWVRNWLVLLPIVLTWYSLSQATTNFNAMLLAAPSNVLETISQMPFLFIWEQDFYGYGGAALLGHRFTFSNVALIDAILIGLVILLTVVIHFRLDYLNSLSAQKTGKMRRQLEKILWETSQLFASAYMEQLKISVSPTEQSQATFNAISVERENLAAFLEQQQRRFLDAVCTIEEQMLTKIRDENAALIQMIIDRQAEIGKLNGFVKVYEDGTQKIQHSAGRFLEAADALHGTVPLLKTLGDSQRQFVDQIGEIVPKLDALGRVAVSANLTAERATGNAEALAGLSTGLAEGLDAIRNVLEDERTANKTFAGQLKEVAERIETSNLRTDASLRTLTGQIQQMSGAFQQITEARPAIVEGYQTNAPRVSNGLLITVVVLLLGILGVQAIMLIVSLFSNSF